MTHSNMAPIWSGKRVTVTGGGGFLGAHVCDELRARGLEDAGLLVPRKAGSDLRTLDACLAATEGRDAVFHLAANVGGIGYNKEHPAELFRDNMLLGVSLIEACRLNAVKKLVIVGTVCSYPKFAASPFKEEELWRGYPEETNAAYGVAKLSLLTMAQAYRSQYGLDTLYLIPTNLYGPGDHFEPERSHVIPALIRRFVEARDASAPRVEAWGTGSASREFLHVRDAARGIVLAAERHEGGDPVNLGTGRETTIRELTERVAAIVGYRGEIAWDASKPDGQPRRSLDVARAAAFGFKADIPLEAGLEETIRWYESH